MTFSRMVLLGAVLAAIVHAAMRAPTMPPHIASHFGLDGRADGWSGAPEFLVFYALAGFLTVGVVFIVAASLGRTAEDALNIPHRDYWLAPERREQTLCFVRGQLEWLAIGLVLFFVATFEATIGISRAGLDRLPPGLVWGAVGLLLAWALVVAGRIRARFSRRPD